MAEASECSQPLRDDEGADTIIDAVIQLGGIARAGRGRTYRYRSRRRRLRNGSAITITARAVGGMCALRVLLHDGAPWTLRAIESIPMTKADPPRASDVPNHVISSQRWIGLNVSWPLPRSIVR